MKTQKKVPATCSTVKYRGKKYPVRTIIYAPKEDLKDVTTSYVSTTELNDILEHDTSSKVLEISREATELDNEIAFFLPEKEMKFTTSEFVLGLLNRNNPDFVFTKVF